MGIVSILGRFGVLHCSAGTSAQSRHAAGITSAYTSVNVPPRSIEKNTSREPVMLVEHQDPAVITDYVPALGQELL